MDNQVTTPTSDKTPEEIEREMMLTRESLTEKVAALENQVVGTVQTAADTITGTVEAVKSLVTNAPETVSDTVKQAADVVSEKMKETFDITGQVRKNPWGAVGISAGLGFLTGFLVFRESRSTGAPPPTPVHTAMPTAGSAASRSAPSQPGMFDEFITMIGQRLRELAETAIESASTSVKANIQHGVPKLVDDAAARLTDTDSGDSSPVVGRFDGARRMSG